MKKKPVKLEWKGGLLSQEPAENAARVPLKTRETKKQVKSRTTPASLGLSKEEVLARAKALPVTARRQVKGRAGKPVYVLECGNAFGESELKVILKELKNKLSCGGTIEGGTIVLLYRKYPLLEKALLTLFKSCREL